MSNAQNHTPEQPHENPKRVQLTQTAASLITGQRQEDYGPPVKNFQRIANYWSIRLEDKLKDGVKITPREVAELMALLKTARATQSPTDDSFIDGIGYIAIAGELGDIERKAEKELEEGYAALAAEHQEEATKRRKSFRSASEWRDENGFSEDGK